MACLMLSACGTKTESTDTNNNSSTNRFIAGEEVPCPVGKSFKLPINQISASQEEIWFAEISDFTVTKHKESDINNIDDCYLPSSSFNSARFYPYQYKITLNGKVDEMFAGRRIVFYTSIALPDIDKIDRNVTGFVNEDGTFSVDGIIHFTENVDCVYPTYVRIIY